MSGVVKSKGVVVVTGGGRGIGAACGELFLQEGYDVVIASRSESELKAVVHKCEVIPRLLGQKILYKVTDIGNIEEIEKLFVFTREQLGYCTVLVNNAGMIIVEDFLHMHAQQFDQLMQVNLRGAFFSAQFALRHMSQVEYPCSIVNISSLGGLAGLEKFRGFSAYSISKFGMVGLTETLAVEAKPFGVRVNCIAPGAVDTQMLKEAAPFLKTNTTPMDIAQVVFNLADEEKSKAINGITIPIYSNL